MPSFNSIFHRVTLTTFFVGALSVAGCAQTAMTKLPTGADLQIGGSGAAPGLFGDLLDTTFDDRGQLWTLEGPTTRVAGEGSYPGNDRIQVFDGHGQFVRQFPLGIEGEPAHLAVDGQGTAYVSFPTLNRVVAYDGRGRKSGQFTVPGANGLTVVARDGQSVVAAIGGLSLSKTKRPTADRIFVLDGAAPTPVTLSRGLTGVTDLSADPAGNFYASADVNSIYVFSPQGQLIRTIGAGTSTRATDGSEVQSSVAVAPDGSVYTLAQTYLVKFDARGDKMTRRAGVFEWYEPWNVSVLAVDPTTGQLWATSTALVKSPRIARYHYRPALLRLKPDFFTSSSVGTLESSTAALGLNPQISSAAPDGVAFDLQPFRVNVSFPAASRNLSSLDGLYRVYDAYKNVVTQGRFNVPLRDGQAASTSFTFTPPRYGAYSADVSLQSGGKLLSRLGANFGVTPPYVNLPQLGGQPSADSRVDPPRSLFAGLPAVRLTVTADPKTWDAAEKTLAEANRVGANVWMQFPDRKDATPEIVRAVVTRFKGRVKVYEIVNEPDLAMKPAAYLELLRPVSQIIRQTDPNAQVMGPPCVTIRLPWYQAFFEGGGQMVDIVSFHDYEGNESIDPVHWRAAIGALRDLMKRSGIADKPLWQTERAIAAVRVNNFSGLQQAIRMVTHDDILQTLGIPAEHNLHYYVNEGGYSTVPSYVWSSHGPHPAVFVLRTRYALTRNRNFAGNLDFGANGNAYLSGLRYRNSTDDIISLRTQATAPQTVAFAVRGAGSYQVTDSFGNQSTLNAQNGELSLQLGQMPIYVRVPRGTDFVAPRLDFGRNIAAQARFDYSGETSKDFSLLTNGVLEANHGGLPGSDSRSSTLWRGALPDPGYLTDDATLQNPPALSLTFPAAKSVSAFVVYGMPADNSLSELLDFDVQVRRGNNWQTVAAVRTDDPISEMITMAPTAAVSWASDTATFVVRLPQPLSAREWRLIPRRTTYGLAADPVAARAMKETEGKVFSPQLVLREVEVYGE